MGMNAAAQVFPAVPAQQLVAVQPHLAGVQTLGHQDAQLLSKRVTDTVTFPTFLKDIPKAVLATGAVVVPNLDGYGKAWYQGFRCAKNVCSGLEFPGKVAGAVHRFETAQNGWDYAEGAARSIDVVSSVTDTVTLCNETGLFSIESAAMTVIGALGCGASVLAAGFMSIREVIKLVEVITDPTVNEINYEKMGAHLINSVKFICYTSLATFGLIALVFAAVAAPWLIATLAIISVVTSVGGFFYDKIVDPENKYGQRLVGTFI